MSKVYSSEQIEEMRGRFHALIPRVVADGRFMTGIAQNKAGDLLPFVCLAVDNREGDGMPPRYIKVIKTKEDQFMLIFEGFFISVGVGVPAPYWPLLLPTAELDERIIDVWERWFALNEAVAVEVARLAELHRGPRPLPL